MSGKPDTEQRTTALELTAYRLNGDTQWNLRPAPLRRDWMDAFKDQWPYRCLPLNIANQAGWELLCPVSFDVIWDGGSHPNSLRIEFDNLEEQYSSSITSHFGEGVLTFWPPLLFRTLEPVGLFVRGPCNFWIDGAAALDGWVESWGLEATFTMNWKIIRTDTPVRFEQGQPLCLLQPFDVGLLERARPVLRDLADDPDLQARYEQWKTRRLMFGTVRRQDQSQNTYTRGYDEAGSAVAGHRTGVNLRSFSTAGSSDATPQRPDD